MTTFDSGRWHHVLARQLQIKPSHALTLQRRHVLPDRNIRNESVAHHWDMPAILAVEHHRPLFDTPAAPFIADLRQLARLLLDGDNESPPAKALVEFRHFSFGADSNGLYPITRFAQPWRGHRVPVSIAQLDAAGYRDFAAQWKGSNNPYGCVKVGGEVPLGPFAWVYATHIRPNLRPLRAAFLARLANVVEAQS